MDRIRDIIKKNEFLTNIIVGNSWILNRVIYLQTLVYIVKKNKLEYIYTSILHWLAYYLLGIKYDIKIKISNKTFIIPNSMKWLDAIIEVFTDPLYNIFIWYKNVLDLGGYMGESAVRMSEHNENIVVYEAHPKNFSYLQKNISPYSNIIWYNYVVMGNSDKDKIEFYWGEWNMGAWTNVSSKNNKIFINTVSLKEILSTKTFDAIKMDIEWWEYDCLKIFFNDADDLLNNIKAGIIEFHFNGDSERYNFFNDFIKLLQWRNYECSFLNIHENKYLEITENNITQFELIILYFLNRYEKF